MLQQTHTSSGVHILGIVQLHYLAQTISKLWKGSFLHSLVDAAGSQGLEAMLVTGVSSCCAE